MAGVILGALVVISLGVLVWMVSLLVGDLSAATFIPTPTEHMDKALELLNMKPGGAFVDLGSGDGKLVIEAARKYQVQAVGYEISPLLVIYSRLMAKLRDVPNAKFSGKNFWKADLAKFDYIYCYLYPPAMKKLAPKLDKELKKGTVVISKAFEMKEWKDKLVKKVDLGGKVLWVYRV
jgi:ribosomal protein L11 methylase PrmA